MPLWPQFLGGAYRARSAFLAGETCINLYLDTIEDDANAKKAMLLGTPGRSVFLTVDQVGARGGFQQDGRSWFVIGATLYEVFLTTAIAISRGIVKNDGAPVTFASNGNGGQQLAICSAGELRILNLLTNVLSAPIALPFDSPVMVDFIDSYFLLLQKDSPTVFFSAPEDGTSWNGGDFFARSNTSDNLVGIKVFVDRIWCLGSQTGQLFYNSGDATNPFQPYPGTVMQEGLVSPWAMATLGESLAWVATDNFGRNRMVTASAPTPQVISTPAISYALAQYPTITDVEALSYEQEGHPFVAWTFPSAGITWCYDGRTQSWHQRQDWDSVHGTYRRWGARGLVADGAVIVVGEATTNRLCALDLDTYTDAGAIIRRERRSPYLSDENQYLFLDSVELGIESGVGLVSGQGVDPQVMLRVSGDSGQTWNPVVTAPLGALGHFHERAIWQQLGRHRSDRLLLEVSQTDPVKTAWGPGVWIRATPGSGML